LTQSRNYWNIFNVKLNFALTPETTSLKCSGSGLVGISFAYAQAKRLYIPCPKSGRDQAIFRNPFVPLFEMRQISETGKTVKYDILSFSKTTGSSQRGTYDTIARTYLIEPEESIPWIGREAYLN